MNKAATPDSDYLNLNQGNQLIIVYFAIKNAEK